MRLSKPALTPLLLILTTLGAPHLDSEMWVYAQSPQPTITAPTLKVYARETVVDVTVTDAKGNPVTGLSQTIKMPLTSAQYRQFIRSPYQFTQQLDLPSGQLFLRIGVLDPPSGKLGTLEIPLAVPKK
jgi:hypothetical protein